MSLVIRNELIYVVLHLTSYICVFEGDGEGFKVNLCVFSLCVTGLTAAAMAELQKLQKMKMMMSLQNGNESDNDDIHSNTGTAKTHTQTAL